MEKSFEIQNSKFKILFMGTPDLSAEILEQLISSGINIEAVVTRPDKPKGRSKDPKESPVKTVAKKYQVPTFQPANKTELEKTVKEIQPDLVIVAAFGMILPQSVLDVPKKGIINVHPSLLPKYRGPAPIEAAILNGDEKTGVTIMEVSLGMDEGNIIEQRVINLTGSETTPGLEKTIAKISTDMLVQIIPTWILGQLKSIPQAQKKATYTKMIKKEEGRIDFEKETAQEIERKSRAFQPWPGVYAFWNGKKIDFYDISVISKGSVPFKGRTLFPGEVRLKDEEIIIGTKNGGILPRHLKLEGKNKIATKDFLRGYPGFIDSKLS